MNTLHPFELALLAAVVLLILEVFTGTFVFLSFCLGSLSVAGAEFMTGTFALGRDSLLFGTISALAIIALRKLFGRSGDAKRPNGDINDY